ncbi:putative initiator Rep protein (plasmid) [Selenomonas ruminantium subsp. lactilytica TAM6421]|uniref:Putative initiator Rep protein n=1 Tax=Selenomonas ruminantium subsp. lactilytica (strain NBRC 103574 / TAM6421) TaxID=927704 RepID=I0GVG6_SELRL|nr:replication initiation protein [Selenomonas ruminantium]BAL84753.1 putative initiator Rep protein [Selenomonas ruminantium subsp. lactilytica TAM6421]
MSEELDERRPIIYQSNPLVEGRQPFGAIEMRLFLLALQHVNPHVSKNDKFYDEAFKDLRLSPGQVKKVFGHGEYLNRLESICDGMAEKVVTLRDSDGGFTKYPIFGRIKYRPEDGLLIKFNEDMRPLILDILESGRGYTKLDAKQLFGLHSAYAVRLLELMLQYRGMMQNNIITRNIAIEDLRFLMNIEDGKYKHVGSFVQTVIETPINDINQSTEYNISYEKVRNGRKIIGFIFSLDCSEVTASQDVQRNIQLEMTPSKKERHGLSIKVVTQLTTLCGSNEEFEKRMEHALKLAEQRKPENLQGFLYNAIKENYRQQDLDTQAAIERELTAIKENNEWEQVAKKLFGGEVAIDESKEEIPFDKKNKIEAAIVKVICKELRDRKLSFTSRSRLEDHNMSVERFLELYA